MLRDLAEISKILNRMRRRRGALDFDFPEYKVLLDLDGIIVAYRKTRSNYGRAAYRRMYAHC